MDDEMRKLRQPLISSSSEDESDGSVDDNEYNGLLPHRTQFDERVAPRRIRRRRKDEKDWGKVLKKFAISVQTLKLFQLISSWMVSLSSAVKLLVPRSTSPSPVSLSMQMNTHRRKMDEVSDRALALLAITTLSFCFVLLLVVYTHTA
ncbi:uncharacterized protein PHALS_08755 [Plasmopara halstedii]|uniref:Transmembrane protein n=1 Tax=Plasmopara halstedii TaxID=4781 RepID=A0A0P1ACR2_PLAHL|nr:uncharacterized protein PHALS_08755 [Plasmopara halstedii]CEG38696.1 hypothetical protein PHALS_08755 [Plasmopara halstedii]|eukprot:XP_024575065.1 hypothetical protein PHALS_08755 [Plasmopara halstedii]